MHQIDQLSSVNQTEVQQDLEDLLFETRGELDGLHHEVLTNVDGSQLFGMIESQMKEGGNRKSYSSMKHVHTSDTLAQMVLDYLGLGTTKIDALEGAMSFAGYKELQQQYVDVFGPTIQINGETKNMMVDGYKGPQFWKAASMLIQNTIVGPTEADVISPEAPIVEQQQNPSLDEPIQDVASVKGDLEQNGFLLKSSGKGFEEDGTSKESNRTSLVGLRQSTVTGMKSMMARLNIHYPGSKLIITGGTEGGIHSNNGEHTHGNGYKIDLSTRGIKGNASKELIALTQVTQGGGRMYWKIPAGYPFGDQEQRIGVDREPSYVDKNGIVQKDHLDIVFYPPGYVLPRDKKGNPIEQEGYAVQDDNAEKAGEAANTQIDSSESLWGKIQLATSVNYDANNLYTRKEYISLVKDIALEVERQAAALGFTIPAKFLIQKSIAEAQGDRIINEKGDVDKRIPSKKVQVSNNFFGITTTESWNNRGGETFASTDKNAEGKVIDQNFRKYASIEESFSDYANMMISGKFSGIFKGKKTTDEIYAGINASDYAENKSYGALLKSIRVDLA